MQPHLKMVVVIPIYDEPDLLLLNSLSDAIAPGCHVAVVLVFNAAEDSAPAIVQRNRHLKESLSSRIATVPSWMSIESLVFEDLPAKHAGVGLARKIGMDRAVEILMAQPGSDSGIIVSLDADCLVSPNYFSEIFGYFGKNPTVNSASIYFEHRLDQNIEAMVQYELFLRCYVRGLRVAEYPRAFHTVGSCMAVRASAYIKMGGMNKRQAGEDFYFLHQLASMGSVGTINNCTVFPSSRVSHRTPFGTGPSVSSTLGGAPLTGFCWRCFYDLGDLIKKVNLLRTQPPEQLDLSQGVQQFLSLPKNQKAIQRVVHETAAADTFQTQFFQWLDGLKALQLLNFLSQQHYPRRPVLKLAHEYLQLTGKDSDNYLNVLREFRLLDRFL